MAIENTSVSLKKIFKRSDVSSLLLEFAKALQLSFVLSDAKGVEILRHGTVAPLSSAFAVHVNNEHLGAIQADRDISQTLLPFIHFLAENESEKKALINDALNRYKELILLYEIADRMSLTLDLDEVCQVVLTTASRLIPADNISIMLSSEETSELSVHAAIGTERDSKMTFKPGVGIAGNIYLSGKAEIINNVDGDRRYVPGVHAVASLICAPLKTRERTFGVITTSCEKTFEYAAQHLKLLNLLATQASSAIANARMHGELQETFTGTISALTESLEKADLSSEGHSERVSQLCLMIGKEMGLLKKELIDLKFAAILHDVGKIIFRPDAGMDERQRILGHTLNGVRILQHIKQLHNVIPGVKYHHEHYDGSGLPEGLKGVAIPISARIIAVADAFDKFVYGQNGHAQLDPIVAITELKKQAGTIYDPEVVQTLNRVLTRRKMFVDFFNQ
jgi:putative nucleotidyltransferase with HDIG domain